MWYDPGHWVEFVLAAAASHAWIMPLAIIVATYILEDLSTIVVGILVADGHVNVGVGLVSLWIGIMTGDYGLYLLGMLAKAHPSICRIVEHEGLLPMRLKLEQNLRQVVMSTRFIPGLRLPTYVACGFFRVPFWEFARSVIGATIVWTTGIFFLAYYFGQSTSEWLGLWRWPIAVGAALVLILVAKCQKHELH